MNEFVIKIKGSIDSSQIKTELKAISEKHKIDFKVNNLDTTSKGIKNVNQQLQEMGLISKESTQSIGNMIIKFSQWFLIGTLVASVTRSIRGVISAIVEMDTALTELKKVSDLTAVGLNNVKERAYVLGKELGTTATNVVDAVTEFARAGYELEDAFDLAKVAITLTNVAENITDAGEAANYLISILKGANLEISDAGKLLDELNAISNNYAVNLGDLADMVQRVSGTMTTYGNSIEETMALVTGAYEVLQDERVARGVSTIAARIAGLNEDMEVEEGLANDVSKALEKYAAIDVFDMNGQLRDTYDILGELAGKWDGLTKNAQSVLLNTVAGKQRMDVLSSILTNWENVESSVETAMTSTGSAAQEQAAYLESIQGRIETIKNSFEELADATLNSDIVKWLITAAQKVVEISTATGGLLNTIIALTGSILYIKNIFALIKALKIANVISQTTLAVSALDKAQNAAALSAAKWNIAIGLVMLAYSVITGIINANNAALEAAATQTMAIVDATDEEIESLRELKAEYVSIYSTSDKSEEQVNRLAEIRKELILTYGAEAQALDLLSESYENNTQKLGELEIAALQRQKQEISNALTAEIATLSNEDIVKLTGDYEDWIKAVKYGNIGSLVKSGSIASSAKESIMSMTSSDLAVAKQAYQTMYDELIDKQIESGGTLSATDKKTLDSYSKILTSWDETYANIIKLAQENDEIAKSIAYTSSGLATEVDNLQAKIYEFMNLMAEEQQIQNFESIEEWIARLKTDYADLYEGNKEYIDSITSAFETQIETLKSTDFMITALEDKLSALKEYQTTLEEEKDTQEKLLKIEQARAALAEAQNKKISVFRAGKGMVYETDTSEIQEAQENLQSAIDDAGLDNLSVAIAGLSEVQEYYDQAIIDQLEAGNNDLREYFMDAQKVQEFLALSITNMKEFLSQYITTPETITEIPNIPQNATGTTGFKGGASIVGEKGPEMVNLPKGSGVIPNTDTMKLMSIAKNPSQYLKGTSGGKSQEYNISIGKVVYEGNDYKGFVDQIVSVSQTYIYK